MSTRKAYMRYWLGKIADSPNSAGLHVTSYSIPDNDRRSIHTSTARSLMSRGYAEQSPDDLRLRLTEKGARRLAELQEQP